VARIKILVLSSTRKERDGIAEYTRQVFRPDFARADEVEFAIEDISLANVLATPFKGVNIVHIQHEFFLFDRFVGASVLFYYPYLWFWSKLLGFKIVTTIHSTYNVADLAGALAHFRRFKWLFPFGSIYLRLHLWLVVKLSARVVILSKIGLENIQRVVSQRAMDRTVRYTHLGNYASNIRLQRHGLLEPKFAIKESDKFFVFFGFAWPIKGYEYGIYAADILVNQRGRKDIKAVIVSGETGKATFPGGGQGGTYIGWLKQLTAERKLEPYVIFTGYLPNSDPLLEEIFSEARGFVFPYLDRNFPSGAISTALATGKPMLVTDIRCFQEYEALPSFPEKDSTALADRMQELADDPAAVAKSAAITRRNAEQFSMQKIFDRHLEIYRESLAVGAPKNLTNR
jgi:glycosyltransferase involved in cell wall biosynthesis